MNKKEASLKQIIDQKMLPLYYHDNPEISLEVLLNLYDAGIRAVEYTNRGDHALKNFKVLRKAADKTMKDLFLGIGTIKKEKEAVQFMDEGADFVVCPTINRKVGKAVQQEKLLWIPGCMTTTEIAEAEEGGATVIKIFPGNILGPAFIRSIKEIFPGLLFIPTGGVEPEQENLRAWFNAGVTAVGMGSRLITKRIMDEKDFETLKKETANALELVRSAAPAVAQNG